ncbi:MAG: hypothetical protein J6M23_06525 [Bacteroidales bacterium]|nr:hypothetical protein [Bacteroidales bacterium]
MKRFLRLAFLLAILPACSVKVDLDADILMGEETAVCWMENLPDDTPLTRLSIPGAHDASSSSITAWTAWTRTQEMNVAELWNCGVRAFDLRPALVDGELGVFHDKYTAHVSFPQVMQSLILALGKHPLECAVVIIRHEEEADGNDPAWKSAMGSYLDSIRDHLADYSPGLSLGKLRGKILVLSRSEYDGGPYGGYICGWSHSGQTVSQKGASVVDSEGSASPLWVQDYYHPDGADDKWAAVKGLLDETSGAALVINHASGYVGSLPDYRANARNINSKVAEYISERQASAGIVMMDFAGVDRSGGVAVGGAKLVRALIDNN